MNGIQGKCSKCSTVVKLDRFVHIVSVEIYKTTEERIKHLLSDSDFCYECKSYISARLSCNGLDSNKKLKNTKIELENIRKIDESKIETILINYILNNR